MTPHPPRADLDAAVLTWISKERWEDDDNLFDALALRLFAHQYQYCEPYRRWCDALGRAPARVTRWHDIPAVPSGAFKELRLASFPESNEVAVFQTSGTSTARRGALPLDTLSLYHASLRSSLDRMLFPDLTPGQRMTLRFLAPSPEASPESSLSHMFGRLLADRGDEHSGYDVRDGALEGSRAVDALAQGCERGRPVALLGTAFSFVHLLEQMGSARFTLPPGSRVMETGGFKGKAREVPREALHASLAEAFGLGSRAICNQYGMTELGSQFYDSVWCDPAGPRRKLIPPWVRVQLLDPESELPVAPGAPGLIQIHDLANTGSVAAIRTADLGRALPGEPDGFEVLGRLEGAEERGCSIAADEMLEQDG
jgi:hypothetical protein